MEISGRGPYLSKTFKIDILAEIVRQVRDKEIAHHLETPIEG